MRSIGKYVVVVPNSCFCGSTYIYLDDTYKDYVVLVFGAGSACFFDRVVESCRYDKADDFCIAAKICLISAASVLLTAVFAGYSLYSDPYRHVLYLTSVWRAEEPGTIFGHVTKTLSGSRLRSVV